MFSKELELQEFLKAELFYLQVNFDNAKKMLDIALQLHLYNYKLMNMMD